MKIQGTEVAPDIWVYNLEFDSYTVTKANKIYIVECASGYHSPTSYATLLDAERRIKRCEQNLKRYGKPKK